MLTYDFGFNLYKENVEYRLVTLLDKMCTISYNDLVNILKEKLLRLKILDRES